MNRPSQRKSPARRHTVFAAALVVLAAPAALAQTWQTVDDHQYLAGQPSVNFGLTVAPSGMLFASGYGFDASGTSHGLVVSSADGGSTWSGDLDDFVYPGSTTRHDNGIVADSAGNLYVAGRYYFSTGNFHQYVRRSADGGGTWVTVDDVAVGNSIVSPLGAGGITADAAGNVYVIERPVGAWTIRKGIGGTNFTTVDTFQSSGSTAFGVFAHPTAGVFAAGYGQTVVKKNSSQAWIVRRSLDGGATWSTVDAYQASSGSAAEGCGIGADANGNIYVVGRAVVPYRGSSINHWIVRKSTNGGVSWSTVEDYALFTSGNQVALGFAADSNGNLFVAGWASAGTGTGPYYWIVRESLGGTGAWTTVDNFPYDSSAMAHAIAADSSGNVFVGGQGSPASGGVHWLVRKK